MPKLVHEIAGRPGHWSQLARLNSRVHQHIGPLKTLPSTWQYKLQHLRLQVCNGRSTWHAYSQAAATRLAVCEPHVHLPVHSTALPYCNSFSFQARLNKDVLCGPYACFISAKRIAAPAKLAPWCLSSATIAVQVPELRGSGLGLTWHAEAAPVTHRVTDKQCDRHTVWLACVSLAACWQPCSWRLGLSMRVGIEFIFACHGAP